MPYRSTTRCRRIGGLGVSTAVASTTGDGVEQAETHQHGGRQCESVGDVARHFAGVEERRERCVAEDGVGESGSVGSGRLRPAVSVYAERGEPQPRNCDDRCQGPSQHWPIISSATHDLSRGSALSGIVSALPGERGRAEAVRSDLSVPIANIECRPADDAKHEARRTSSVNRASQW